MKYVVLLLAVALAGALGWILNGRFSGPSLEDRATMAQDQIHRIAKFATAEGEYARMFRYEDKGSTDWLSFTDKRVIVQAHARVVMGYDLEGVTVEVDRDAKEFVVTNWPEAEEIAFEFDTELFDVQEGLFVSVDKDVLNAVNRGARKRMRERIDYAALRRESREQAEELLSLISQELEQNGWTLRVEGWDKPVEVLAD